MKHNYTLYALLLLTLLIRLPFAFGWHEILWDGGVYIGMGKHIYSGGEQGLWEHIRPPLLPFALGLFWTLGLDTALLGRLLEIILMLGIVWLTYLLAKHWTNEPTAIISAIIVAVSPIFYYLSFHQYTEIPSTFFVLLSLWLLTKKYPLYAGLAAGGAFLAKFPAGMIIAIILLYLAVNKEWKQALLASLGFTLAALPYFIWSWIAYGSPLATFVAAQDAINRALGCNVLRARPWYEYFRLLFVETKLHLFALPGIFALTQRWKKNHLLLVLCIIVPLLYFSQLSCRDYRYLTLFLPFVAILTAYGIYWTIDYFTANKKIFIFIVVLLTLWMLHTSILFYNTNEKQTPSAIEEDYFGFIDTVDTKKELWTANPIVAVYTDKQLLKIYYPIYDTKAGRDFVTYVNTNKDNIGAVILDNCGGGIICPPNDEACEQQTQELIDTLDKQFSRAYDKQSGRCWYTIWTS